VSSAHTTIAESLATVAGLTVYLKHIRWTIFALTGAVFRQIALVLSSSALRACSLRPTSLQIATLAGSTARVTVQHTSGHVAAGIVAVFLQTAITLLAWLNESITAYRTIKKFLRLVSQAVIHPVFEG